MHGYDFLSNLVCIFTIFAQIWIIVCWKYCASFALFRKIKSKVLHCIIISLFFFLLFQMKMAMTIRMEIHSSYFNFHSREMESKSRRKLNFNEWDICIVTTISKAGFNFHFSGDLSESNFSENAFNFVTKNLNATVKVHISEYFMGDCDVFAAKNG